MEYGIKIDSNDIHIYDYNKVNSDGKSIFLLMAECKDQRLISVYKSLPEIMLKLKESLRRIAI